MVDLVQEAPEAASKRRTRLGVRPLFLSWQKWANRHAVHAQEIQRQEQTREGVPIEHPAVASEVPQAVQGAQAIWRAGGPGIRIPARCSRHGHTK